jgi:PAS domain S-box-containing protein
MDIAHKKLLDKEKQRLDELLSLNILDTEKEVAFDRITKIVSKAFDMPICLISLVDKDRQWFKSCVGLDVGISETSREVAFCHYVVVNEQPLIVEDATKDHRFAENPLVTGDFGIRFYAGAPLRTKKGNILGSLCLIDTKPRKFDINQMMLLDEYVAFVMSELELRNMLRENAFLSTAINKTATGILITDPLLPDNPVIYANEAFTKITGYSVDDVIGSNCRFLQGPKSCDASKVEISKAIKSGSSISIEIENYKKDGTPFWNELKIDPIFDNKGKLTHFIGFQTDITSKKNAEIELSIRKQRYEALFHRNSDAVYMIDAKGAFIEVNDACEKLTGYTSSEFEKIYFLDLIMDPYKEKTLKQFLKVIENFQQVEFETQLRHKSGKVKYLSVKANPIFIDGIVIGLYGISKDITLIKESQKQIKIIAKLFENMKEAALILDENFNVITINNTLNKLINLNKDKILNRNVSLLVDRYVVDPSIYQEISTTVDQEKSWEGKINLKLDNGEHRTLWLMVDTILDDEGKRTNLMCILRNLSEKEQIQNDVKMAGLMQHSSLPSPLDNKFISVSSIFKPSQYVSGDFYDYKWINDQNKLVGILYDAMGHGVATALQTSVLRVLFNNISKNDLPLPDKVKYINNEMINYLSEETFVAALYFEFDLSSKILNYVPCGINEIILERKQTLETITTPAFLIGMFKEAQFELHQLQLHDEDSLYFLTDGITDLLPSHYPVEFLQEDNFFSYLEKISSSVLLDDDATALKLTLKPQETNLLNEVFISKDSAHIDQIKRKVTTILSNVFVLDTYFVELAFNEALNNAIRASDKIELLIFRGNDYLGITIIDDGPGFDVKKKLNELMNKNDMMMEELVWSESGRGIYLMHKCMDKVEYNLQGNQVTLFKKLGGKKDEDKHRNN